MDTKGQQENIIDFRSVTTRDIPPEELVLMDSIDQGIQRLGVNEDQYLFFPSPNPYDTLLFDCCKDPSAFAHEVGMSMNRGLVISLGSGDPRSSWRQLDLVAKLGGRGFLGIDQSITRYDQLAGDGSVYADTQKVHGAENLPIMYLEDDMLRGLSRVHAPGHKVVILLTGIELLYRRGKNGFRDELVDQYVSALNSQIRRVVSDGGSIIADPVSIVTFQFEQHGFSKHLSGESVGRFGDIYNPAIFRI